MRSLACRTTFHDMPLSAPPSTVAAWGKCPWSAYEWTMSAPVATRPKVRQVSGTGAPYLIGAKERVSTGKGCVGHIFSKMSPQAVDDCMCQHVGFSRFATPGFTVKDCSHQYPSSTYLELVIDNCQYEIRSLLLLFPNPVVDQKSCHDDGRVSIIISHRSRTIKSTHIIRKGRPVHFLEAFHHRSVPDPVSEGWVPRELSISGKKMPIKAFMLLTQS